MNEILSEVRRLVRRNDLIYFPLCGWKKVVRRLRAYPDSELVLEAYPRSANTTSMYALFYAQKRELKVGHHLHVPAHVKYAVRHNIPCLVIMRPPLDCVASLLVMRNGGDSRVLLQDYIDFARVAQECRENILIVSFDRVVNQGMGVVIRDLNQRFNTDFYEPDGSVEEEAWVKERIREWNRIYSGGDEQRLSFPTEAKRERSRIMKERVQEEADLLAEADRLYRLTVGSEGAQ